MKVYTTLFTQSQMADFGSHGIIIPMNTKVEKKSRRSTGHSIEVQMTIHRIVQNILRQGNYNHIRVPLLSDVNPRRYKMERISTWRPVVLGEAESSMRVPNLDEVNQELVRLWIEIWENGYAAWDFDLFLQADGKIVLLDFDRFGLRMSNQPPYMPLQIPVGSFFNHSCFPTDFKMRVQDQIHEVLDF
jgi:hypothetical protein